MKKYNLALTRMIAICAFILYSSFLFTGCLFNDDEIDEEVAKSYVNAYIDKTVRLLPEDKWKNSVYASNSEIFEVKVEAFKDMRKEIEDGFFTERNGDKKNFKNDIAIALIDMMANIKYEVEPVESKKMKIRNNEYFGRSFKIKLQALDIEAMKKQFAAFAYNRLLWYIDEKDIKDGKYEYLNDNLLKQIELEATLYMFEHPIFRKEMVTVPDKFAFAQKINDEKKQGYVSVNINPNTNLLKYVMFDDNGKTFDKLSIKEVQQIDFGQVQNTREIELSADTIKKYCEYSVDSREDEDGDISKDAFGKDVKNNQYYPQLETKRAYSEKSFTDVLKKQPGFDKVIVKSVYFSTSGAYGYNVHIYMNDLTDLNLNNVKEYFKIMEKCIIDVHKIIGRESNKTLQFCRYPFITCEIKTNKPIEELNEGDLVGIEVGEDKEGRLYRLYKFKDNSVSQGVKSYGEIVASWNNYSIAGFGQ